MNVEIIKKYKWLFVLGLVVIVGVFPFFYRMGSNDAKALTEFPSSYEKFDKAISDLSIGEDADLESKAGDALIELNAKGATRISSLTKNDGQLMNMMLEIADLSKKELDELRAYKKAVQSKNADSDKLAKEYGDLTSKRKAAYVHFQELAGPKY